MKPTPLALRCFLLATTTKVACSRSSNFQELDVVDPGLSVRKDQQGRNKHDNRLRKQSAELVNHYDFSEHFRSKGKEDLELCEPDQGILACTKQGECCQQDEDSHEWHCLPSEDWSYGNAHTELCEPDQGLLACTKQGESCQHDEDSHEWHCLPSEDWSYGNAYPPFGTTMEYESHHNSEMYEALDPGSKNAFDLIHGRNYANEFSWDDHAVGIVPHAKPLGASKTSNRLLSSSFNCPDPRPKVPQDEPFNSLVRACVYNNGCPQGFEDLSCWNTSAVTNMERGFYYIYDFNGDISDWDVSSVTTMRYMFYYSAFNGDISRWNVSNLLDGRSLFQTSLFNGNVSNWDVSRVTDMRAMFESSYFDGDISEWDVGSVTNMEAMFLRTKFDRNISQWDVASVTVMSFMFSDSDFNGDVSNWDVSNVQDMHSMFSESPFNGDVSAWDVGSVQVTEAMFYRSQFNGDVSAWDVASMRNTERMFMSTPFNVDISGWDLSASTDMARMFRDSEFNQNLGDWAFKVPENAWLYDIFLDSDCPIQADPRPGVLPWCQDVSSSECEDDGNVEFSLKRRKYKTCEKIAKLVPKKSLKQMRKICGKKAFKPSKERVKDYCRETCGRLGFGPGKRCSFPN